MMRSARRSIVMALWFMLQPERAKKMYIIITIANEQVYIPSVEPMRSARQPGES